MDLQLWQYPAILQTGTKSYRWLNAQKQCMVPVHILVNNGAAMGGGKPVNEVNEKEFDRLIDINLKVYINLFMPCCR